MKMPLLKTVPYYDKWGLKGVIRVQTFFNLNNKFKD